MKKLASFGLDVPKTMFALKLIITYALIDLLRPDPGNARSHSESQIRSIAKSIAAFGFIIPILVDATGLIITGHARWLAAKLLGLKEVPTIQVGHLSPTQRQAFAIADNRLSELASWDDQQLAEQLKILSSAAIDFNIDAIGFSPAEIDLRIEGLKIHTEEVDIADQLPRSSGPVVSRLGDSYILGNNRVLCGDALNISSYQRLMGPAAAHIIFADPPFNVPIAHHATTARGKSKFREFPMASGEMSPEEYTEFLVTVLKQLAQFSKPGSLHYLCIDWRHLAEMLAAGQKAYSELKNLCVWAKSNGGMGTLYRSQHELVLVFKNGDAPHQNNIQLGRFGRNRSNVWNYPSPSAFGKPTDKDDTHGVHPTTKPVALIADILLDASRRGDIVLDAFMGSGSTLIAAERTGRKCFGMELDPLYVDATVQRWQEFTGKAAFHESGVSFSDLAKKREDDDDH